ncbi:hypothetical protein HDK77DRAFT_450816 [Phyllosticta capitalensis]
MSRVWSRGLKRSVPSKGQSTETGFLNLDKRWRLFFFCLGFLLWFALFSFRAGTSCMHACIIFAYVFFSSFSLWGTGSRRG